MNRTADKLSENIKAIADELKTPKKKRESGKIAQDLQSALREIQGQIETFCREHLNAEYAELCRKLAEKLASVRPSPLMSGKPNVWACGIIRTIGMQNFLNDPSQKPYMKIAEISRIFGVGESTAAARTSKIKNLIPFSPLDFEWNLPSQAEQNPLIWFLKVNGIMMDIRDAPREAQVVAFEQGLIPYIPADRKQGG